MQVLTPTAPTTSLPLGRQGALTVWTLPNNGGTGFTLTTGGLLSGVTPVSGTYTLAVSVTADDGASAHKPLAVTVP
jgi:hypothetical protein